MCEAGGENTVEAFPKTCLGGSSNGLIKVRKGFCLSTAVIWFVSLEVLYPKISEKNARQPVGSGITG